MNGIIIGTRLRNVLKLTDEKRFVTKYDENTGDPWQKEILERKLINVITKEDVTKRFDPEGERFHYVSDTLFQPLVVLSSMPGYRDVEDFAWNDTGYIGLPVGRLAEESINDKIYNCGKFQDLVRKFEEAAKIFEEMFNYTDDLQLWRLEFGWA